MMREADRRAFLKVVGKGGLAGLALHGSFAVHAAGLASRRHVQEAPSFRNDPFALGVAAGDPAADGFVIWTRLAPEPLAPLGGLLPEPVLVRWEVAEDARFRRVVRQGEAIAHPELAHSVHVEVTGLRPHRLHHYRFRAGNARSATGRAQTLPLAGAPLDRLRFAVAGCQHYEQGLYTAWRHIADEAPDFVFHYGDYIYEGADRGDRPHIIHDAPYMPVRRHGMSEPYSLDDYRRRYALYKSDMDLQAAHAACAFFPSCDDHEVDNNWAGPSDEDGTPEEVFALRRAAAFQAFYEHMPLRPSAMPHGGQMRMFRQARFGDLVDAWFLDTRQYRSDQPCGDGVKSFCVDMSDPGRTILGTSQRDWLLHGLTASQGRWTLLAQQVMMMNLDARKDPLATEREYALDTWSGYLADRERLLTHLDGLGRANTAIVTGDSHQHFVADVTLDGAREKIVASEFLATSISSGADGTDELPHTGLWLRNNPNLKMMCNRRGYALCHVTDTLWQTDMRVIDTLQKSGGKVTNRASFVLEHGQVGVRGA